MRGVLCASRSSPNKKDSKHDAIPSVLCAFVNTQKLFEINPIFVAGVRQGIRERIGIGEAQTDTQRRAQIRV